MFCCKLLYAYSSFAIILMGKRELVVLLSLSSWCLVVIAWLFLEVPWVCLRFVIVVFPDHTHLLFSEFALWDFNLRREVTPFIEYYLPVFKFWQSLQSVMVCFGTKQIKRRSG